jgi:hypothetical protein
LLSINQNGNAVSAAPAITATGIRQSSMRLKARKSPQTRIRSAEVSPADPAIMPVKTSVTGGSICWNF